MTPQEVTGRARSHVVDVPGLRCALHRDVVKAFFAMRAAALAAGFELTPASGYRDFDRQLAIWNGKYAGERPTYDDAGARLDLVALSPGARIEAILRWSALPGASRHHWGTDLDLYDRSARAAPRLEPAEYAAGGPFAPLSDWLEKNAARFGFFRPYRGDLSGVQAEPWHYSFAPVAYGALRVLDCRVLRAAITAAPLAGKEAVLVLLDDLYARYVARIDPF
ncbi:MAG TPA: M15 family metallopeptidase [Steroidobacteraceae bacterium]|nr:M15 family metallopeptidase [Steroidobacteraceae bacterium]